MMKKAKKEKTKKRRIGWIVALCLLAAAIIAGVVFIHFGGFGTGDCADTAEFAKYAAQTDDMKIPEQARIIALGEATHGNAEFQQLKLTVFQKMVSDHGVCAFGLEGDFGGCETVDRYIHGADMTAAQAVDAIGFEIYRTPEMEQLVEWMREYNSTAEPGGDLRFYGFDMQRYEYSYKYLLEIAGECGIDCTELEKLWDGDGYSADYDSDQRKAVFESVREQLEAVNHIDAAKGMHFADSLMQNIELGKVMNSSAADVPALRDKLMAENALWMLEQEEARGCDAIFLSGHNGHMKQFGAYSADCKVMGNLLADELGDAYFVIGTDFYRSVCSLPTGKNGARRGHTFYSYDPLAKAAKKCGLDVCWLDFSAIPEDSALKKDVSNYVWMGTLGDVPYSPVIMGLLPMSYRVWQTPEQLYDGMIIVTDAHPAQMRAAVAP